MSLIQKTLQDPPQHLPTVVFSLDDLYLTHADQVTLARQHPTNPLLQHRGQPSTHDIALARSIFSSLRQNHLTAIPQYNKAAFDGQGDRVPEEAWERVNRGDGDNRSTIKVVLFEGWAVGFRPLSDADLRQKWEAACQAKERGNYIGRLGHNSLQTVVEINAALRDYNRITESASGLHYGLPSRN